LSSLSFSLILLENQMGRLLFSWKEGKGHKKDGRCLLLLFIFIFISLLKFEKLYDKKGNVFLIAPSVVIAATFV